MYGDLVRNARRSRGLTQSQLAEVSGLAQPNISAIEIGTRQPSAATLHQLLLACGYEVLAVAGDHVIPFPATPDDLPGDAPASCPPVLTVRQRVDAVVAVLDASEATIRSR